MAENVEPLYFGDKHADAVCEAIWAVLQERAVGMSIPTVLGILEIVKDKVKDYAE